MDEDNSQIFHKVVVTDIKDHSAEEKVSLAMARIIKNMSPEEIRKRLDKLPWTLTRKATPKSAARLVRFLDKIGARVAVSPPLSASVLLDAQATQILPDTRLLSQTQVISATQALPEPPERLRQDAPASQTPRPAIRSRQSPQPIEPGQNIQSPETPKSRPAPPPPMSSPGDDSGFDIEPLSLGGILDTTFQIGRAYFWELLAVVGIFWGIITVMNIFATIAGITGVPFKSIGHAPDWNRIAAIVVFAFVMYVVFVGLSFLCNGALIYAVSSIYLGRGVRVREAYTFSLARLHKLIITSLLTGLLFFFSFAVAIIGGVVVYLLFHAIFSNPLAVVFAIPFWLALACIPPYVSMKLMLANEVIIVEDIAYFDAIVRSWKLVSGKAEGDWPRGYISRLAILFALCLIIYGALTFLFLFPQGFLMLVLPRTLALILNHILSGVSGVAGTLLMWLCMVVFYYDIRNRKEGFDLEQLAGARWK
jgi:hypothetical protein